VTIKCVTQPILFSGFGGRKAPSSLGEIGTAEVLRLRAIKPSVCDRSAKRFAQDDGFVGGLKGLEIQLVGYAENTKRSKKSRALRMTFLWEF
jgi:hypothetical protein